MTPKEIKLANRILDLLNKNYKNEGFVTSISDNSYDGLDIRFKINPEPKKE